MQKNKIGLLALISIVISSQLGVGMFILPSQFAHYGPLGLFGWLVSGCGAIILGLVFSELFKIAPETGGPYIYLQKAFGKDAAFFTGWAHWVISAISNVPIVLSGIEYLSYALNGTFDAFFWKALLLTGITGLSLFGGGLVGRVETLLSVAKLLPIIAVPIAGIMLFKAEHFAVFNPTEKNWLNVIKATGMMSMWCFIGLESATIPAASVKDASKTVPKAITIGTLSVLAIYLSNTIGIMSIVPPQVLANSQAPYAEASRVIFGNLEALGRVIPAVAALVCIGNLNAWIFSGGFIAQGLAEGGLLPEAFLAKNRFGAPYIGVGAAYVFTLLCLLLCMEQDFRFVLNLLVGTSVVVFLLIYGLCSASLLLILKRSNQLYSWRSAIAIFGVVFCAWIVVSVGWLVLALSSVFFLSGLPVYLYMKRRLRNSQGTVG